MSTTMIIIIIVIVAVIALLLIAGDRKPRVTQIDRTVEREKDSHDA